MSELAETILSGKIETGNISGFCRWPNKFFPFGFEFRIESLTFRRFEGKQTDTILNPDPDNLVAIVRWDEDKLPKSLQNSYDEDDGTVEIPSGQCEKFLGISFWKLIELLEEQHKNEIYDAIYAVLNSRDYDIVSLVWEKGKVKEIKKKATEVYGGR